MLEPAGKSQRRQRSTKLGEPRPRAQASEKPSRVVSARETRSRIIAAAESLFAEHGFDAVGMREITSAAGVNLALINYHFGSKRALLAEVVTKHATQVVERRLELLSHVARDRRGRPKLDAIISAFLRPALELSLHPSGADYLRIRARLALERVSAPRLQFDKAYESSHQRFVDALAEALPGLPRVEVYWGFHCLMGIGVYTMANSGRVQQLSRGACNTSDVEETLLHIVPFVARGFRDLSKRSMFP